jgi:hypothetical protein
MVNSTIHEAPTCAGAGVAQSEYCLDYRLIGVIGVRFPEETEDFSSNLCVQTHVGSDSMGTVGPFNGVKRGRGVTLTTHTF